MVYQLPVVVMRLKEAGYPARCEDVRASAMGDTIEEAINNLREAISVKGLILLKQDDLPGSHGGVVNIFGQLYVNTGLQKNFDLLSIGLFGSYAKGMPGPNSDIDLLVEFKEPRFEYLAGLQLYLEKKLGRSIELVRKRKGLSERFLKRIEQSILYV